MLNGAGGLNGVGSVSPGGTKFRAGSSRTGFVQPYDAHAVDSQAQTIVAPYVAQSPVDSGQSVPIAGFGYLDRSFLDGGTPCRHCRLRPRTPKQKAIIDVREAERCPLAAAVIHEYLEGRHAGGRSWRGVFTQPGPGAQAACASQHSAICWLFSSRDGT
jgi:hypothetical protein